MVSTSCAACQQPEGDVALVAAPPVDPELFVPLAAAVLLALLPLLMLLLAFEAGGGTAVVAVVLLLLVGGVEAAWLLLQIS